MKGKEWDICNYLMDSGVSSHVTPFLQDLRDPEACNIQVITADISKVTFTKQGSVTIEFTSEQGQV